MNCKKVQSLTPKQTEVFNLILKGLENAEIGKELGIAKETAKVHSHAVLKKLSCKNKKDVLLKYLKRKR